MPKNFSVIAFFIFFSVFLSAASAQEKLGGKIVFSIDSVDSGFWLKARHHMVNDWVDRAPSDEKLSYIAIAYKLINSDNAKKFDLEQNLKYRLVDEFGNQYRQMKKPDDFTKPVLLVSKNFPSLYPGESYGETVFFEAPIAKAQDVRLIIDAKTLGINAPVELRLKRTKKAPSAEIPFGPVALKSQAEPIAQAGAPVEIKDPLDGTVLQQGQTAHLRVVTSLANPPQKVIVIGLEQTYEDREPAMENVYDINVPMDQKTGPYVVNVIAEWNSNSEEKTINSDSITVYVKDAMPLEIL